MLRLAAASASSLVRSRLPAIASASAGRRHKRGRATIDREQEEDWHYEWTRPKPKTGTEAPAPIDAPLSMLSQPIATAALLTEQVALAHRIGLDPDLPRHAELLNQASLLCSRDTSEVLPTESNSRLAFAGKRVISMFTSELLYVNYPSMPGDALADLCDYLTNTEALEKLADSLGIPSLLRTVNEKDLDLLKDLSPHSPFARRALLAKTTRAVAGAIYYASGPHSAQNFTRSFIMPRLAVVDLQETIKLQHPIAMLNHITTMNGLGSTKYQLVHESGRLTHFPTFVVTVSAGTKTLAKGTGPSLRAASLHAARKALAEHFAADLVDAPLPSATEFFRAQVEDDAADLQRDIETRQEMELPLTEMRESEKI